MLLSTVYPIIRLVLWGTFCLFFIMLLARLIFSYVDPNPFGRIGRISFKLRKISERFVYPAARMLAQYRADTRFAPLVTIFVGLVITYFTSSVIYNTCFVLDGLFSGVIGGNAKVFIGFLLYGLLSILVLFIFIRFISSWFVFTRKTFLGFVTRVTDPVLRPVQKLVPPIGMFDFSAMIVLILISLLQSVVLNVFVQS